MSNEKLLPIVPGCRALMFGIHHSWRKYGLYGSHEVTVVERSCHPNAWIVTSETLERLPRHIWPLPCSEQYLMRIDGHEPEAEDVHQSKTLERVD